MANWRQAGMTLFGEPQVPQGGVLGEPQIQQAYNPKLAMAAQLLGGTYSNEGFGPVLARALMAGQQVRQQGQQAIAQQREQQQLGQYRQAQLDQLRRGDSQFGNIDVDQFTPESLAQFQRTKDYGVLVRRPDANMGNFNPGDYTPESFAKFRESGNIRDLVRYVTPANPVVTQVGNVPTVVNPGRGGAPTTSTPLSTLTGEATGAATVAGAEAAATASGRVTGEAAGQAQVDLPKALSTAQQVVSTIDKLSQHKGLPYITGLASKAPIIPGTDQAAADALARQVEGQAFLQAFQTLKGGGTITEKEGEAATAAIARLARAQKTEDYQSALSELRGIANQGMERAKTSATNGAGANPGSPNTAVTRRKYNPATGRIE